MSNVSQADGPVDDTIRVAARTPAASLASAISHAVHDKGSVHLRAIGAASVNQAVKAIAIAQSYVGSQALTLSTRVGFSTVSLPDDQKVSAIVFKVESK
jgi:stage V sporulation protein S